MVLYGVGALAFTLDELEQMGGGSGVVQGRRGDGGGEAGEFGVAGVGLDDDGATGRQGADRVAARDAEREGEVARGEDQDRAERHGGAADVRAGAHRPVGVGVVDADVVQGPGGESLGEEPALEGGAGQFTGEAGLGQVRLAVGDGDEGAGGCVERVGDGGQQAGAFRGRDGTGADACGGGPVEDRVQGQGGVGRGGLGRGGLGRGGLGRGGLGRGGAHGGTS